MWQILFVDTLSRIGDFNALDKRLCMIFRKYSGTKSTCRKVCRDAKIKLRCFCCANIWKFSTIIRIKATMSPVRQSGSSIEERTLEMFSS